MYLQRISDREQPLSDCNMSAVVWLHQMEEAPSADMGRWVKGKKYEYLILNHHISISATNPNLTLPCVSLCRLVPWLSARLGLLHEAGYSQCFHDLLWVVDLGSGRFPCWLVLLATHQIKFWFWIRTLIQYAIFKRIMLKYHVYAMQTIWPHPNNNKPAACCLQVVFAHLYNDSWWNF